MCVCVVCVVCVFVCVCVCVCVHARARARACVASSEAPCSDVGIRVGDTTDKASEDPRLVDKQVRPRNDGGDREAE